MWAFIVILITAVAVYCIYREQQERLKLQEQEKKKRIEQKTRQIVEERKKRMEVHSALSYQQTSRKNCLTSQKIDSFDDKRIKTLSDYAVIDVETTGLNKSFDKIIEIAIITIEKGEIVDQYSTLVNPKVHISESASKVNGIFDIDVQEAPTYQEIVDDVKRHINNRIVLGYNVSFDLDFIQKLLSEFSAETQIEYFDVYSYVKRIIKGLPNYKLQTVANHFEVSQKPNHRALDDTIATNEVFCLCRAEFHRRQETERAERKAERERKKQEHTEKYQGSPLLDTAFVFTGEFSIDRASIEQMALSVGALIRQKVTSNTDYLVVGNLSNLPEWAIERKYSKAKSLCEDRKKVKLIDETKYFSMISSAKEALKSSQAPVEL